MNYHYAKFYTNSSTNKDAINIFLFLSIFYLFTYKYKM